MEPPKGKVVGRQEKIKDILADLGIAGETVSSSAARTIEELTHLGIVKGYSTIVAVGDEPLVNKIITVLATEKTDKDVVLGIIPNDFESILAKKINIGDIRSACNALKFRKLATYDLCAVEPNKYFITEAIIENNRNHGIYFSKEGLQGRLEADQILIKPGLEIFTHDRALEGNSPSRFYRWLFGKRKRDIYSSYFTAKKIRFEAENNAAIPVKVAGEIIAKTPVIIHSRFKVLKIIVARDKMEKTN
jgi:diacylglycerol kinase family enzyme